MSFCNQCGTQAGDAKFCGTCGAPQNSAPQALATHHPTLQQPTFAHKAMAGAGVLPPREVRVAGGKSKRSIMVVSVAIVVALIAGIGVWLFAIKDTTAGGADDPQTAVQGLLDSLSAGDIIGALEQLPPGESRMLIEMATTALSETSRLGLLKSDTSLKKVEGGSITFENLKFGQVKNLSETVAYVPLRGGDVTVMGDLSQAPLTSQVADLLLSNLRQTDGEASVDIGKALDRSNISLPLVAVLVDGDWHPSVLYSAAEFFRQNLNGLDDRSKLPKPLTPVGSASPEGVVTDLLDAATAADVTSMIELLDPTQAAVLYDYAREPIDTFDEQMTRLDVFDAEVVDSAFIVGEEEDGRVPVTVSTLEVRVQVSDSPVVKVLLEYGDGCSFIDVSYGQNGEDGGSQEFCVTDVSEALAGDDRLRAQDLVFTLPPTFVTVEIDGRWYLQPSGTVLAALLPVLNSISAQDVTDYLDRFN